ncbi:unnamed protein product [Pleuronectes platessa]|uniref:Uncharacterized protein n=1 Tax=Pleuronectes platessa TaxID=8262 RepID=A0A9N7Y1L6_PLEPL|nr:unnamed protein product [Pleuronectes platessa]
MSKDKDHNTCGYRARCTAVLQSFYPRQIPENVGNFSQMLLELTPPESPVSFTSSPFYLLPIKPPHCKTTHVDNPPSPHRYPHPMSGLTTLTCHWFPGGHGPPPHTQTDRDPCSLDPTKPLPVQPPDPPPRSPCHLHHHHHPTTLNGGGSGFSGRTCSSMLVFVRGSQIPGWDMEEGGGWVVVRSCGRENAQILFFISPDRNEADW